MKKKKKIIQLVYISLYFSLIFFDFTDCKPLAVRYNELKNSIILKFKKFGRNKKVEKFKMNLGNLFFNALDLELDRQII